MARKSTKKNRGGRTDFEQLEDRRLMSGSINGLLVGTNPSLWLAAQQQSNKKAESITTPKPVNTPTVVENIPSLNRFAGLRAEYYEDEAFTRMRMLRTDSAVDFSWVKAPSGVLNDENYAVRWGGSILAETTDTYTFYTTADDGVRLWVNGQLLINNWTDQSPTTKQGTIELQAGKKYNMLMEYYNGQGTGMAKLEWSNDTLGQQVIPTSNLFSVNVPWEKKKPVAPVVPPVVPVVPPVAPVVPPVAPVVPPVTPVVPPVAPVVPPDVKPIVGTGIGLKGEYYHNSDFTSLALSRTDDVVNFRWNDGTPDSSMDGDTFTVRWTGQVQAQYTETYDFLTTTDDGVRLWVDGKLLVDNWTLHSPTVDSGTIDLVAGQKYDIKMEYFENGWNAEAGLSWSSAHTNLQVIPKSQLTSDTNVQPPVVIPPVVPVVPPVAPVVPPVAPVVPPVLPPTSPGLPINIGTPTITVDKNGAIKTIQQAINIAKAGDVILVKNGTYNEAVTINVSGTATSRITIAAETVGGVVIDASGLAFGINGLSARYINLKGIDINNANSGLQVNAALRVGANWVVEDVEVNRAAVAGIYVAGDNSTFTRTYARDCGQQGWWANADNTTLKDCGATGNNTRKYDPAWEAGGIKFYITNGCVVDGGTWANNGGPAIWFDYQNKNFAVRNTEVYGNHGWNQGWAGVGIVAEISEGPGLFENNYVHDNTGDGIAIWESMNVTVRNNDLVRDTIGFRDMTSRAPYRTRNNQILNNEFFQGQVNTPPANAGNVVSGNTQVASIGLLALAA